MSMPTYLSTFATLKSQGYRPISLSLYGPTSALRLAAIWVKRSGPDYLGFQGLTWTGVKDFLDTHDQYHLTLLSATGDSSSPLFAGIVESGTYNYTQAGCCFPRSEFLGDVLPHMRTSGPRIAAAVPFGSSLADEHWALVYRPNETRDSWDITVPNSAAETQRWFSGLTAGGLRPKAILPTYGVQGVPNTTIWTQDSVGPWYSRVNLSLAAYNSEFDTAVGNGYFPISLQARTLDSTDYFSVIFAKRDTPLPRIWTVRGTDVGLPAFDTWMRNFMIPRGLRAGSLAIARNGELVYARAFTWAESGYPITQPTSTFRIASSSKPLTALATWQAWDKGQVGMNTTMQSVLHVKTPTGDEPSDANWAKVTVGQLLCQRSGINGNVDMFDDRDVASAYNLAALPITKYQEAGWGSTQGFDTTPGTASAYSNFNFSLLGQIVEKITGKGYEQAVRDGVFTPLGVTRPRIGFSELSKRLPGEVRYDTPIGVNGSVKDGAVGVAAHSVNDANETEVVRSYGDWNQQNLDAAGGWVLAPADYAKVMSSWDDGTTPLFSRQVTTKAMWTVCAADAPTTERGWYVTNQPLRSGGTAKAHEHNGSLPSSSFLVIRRVASNDDTGLTFVLGFNRRSGGTKTGDLLAGWREGTELFKIANAYSTWPTKDLFPSVGIPANN